MQYSRGTAPEAPELAKRLGLLDATMIVMGGIIGAGIFITPAVVARHVTSPALIIGAWMAGGLIALAGAFVYAELAALHPAVGGQYAYLRDAYHPVVAFLYGWTLLLVTQTGGMAAVAMTFGFYVRELTGVAVPMSVVAVATLAVLTLVNCRGVRAGSNVQTALMVLKIAAVLFLVVAGAVFLGGAPRDMAPLPAVRAPVLAFAAAMVPVLFSYGGWQTASFISGELSHPRRDLPRGLLIGVGGVILLYMAVTVVCLMILGPADLAATTTPASAVMRRALGPTGARVIALGIAVSTVGFLSQGMLTAPRVYFAMARDGLFFSRVGWVDPVTRAPTVAIALQGVWATVIVLSGKYEQIINYVVAIDAVFFGLTGASLLIFRRREAARARDATVAPDERVRIPGYPLTVVAFVVAFWLLALSTIVQFPTSAGIGVLVLVAGVPMYFFWSRRARRPGL